MHFKFIRFNPERTGKTCLGITDLQVSPSILIATAPTFILRLFDIAVSPVVLHTPKKIFNRILI
jgi:hypothetical protein